MSIKTFPEMIGKTMRVASGLLGRGIMEFVDEEGIRYHFEHEQECCEHVVIDDVVGDMSDLVGVPLLAAEEISSEGARELSDEESYTWTFYRFATVKGTVTVKWLGRSNGYYSEGVSFEVRK